MDRLFQFLEQHAISAYHFEHACGLSNGYLGKQLKGKGAVGSEVLAKIKLQYPEIDIHWLVTGEGSMFGSNETLIRSFQQQIQQLEQMVADKEQIIGLLQTLQKPS